MAASASLEASVATTNGSVLSMLVTAEASIFFFSAFSASELIGYVSAFANAWILPETFLWN